MTAARSRYAAAAAAVWLEGGGGGGGGCATRAGGGGEHVVVLPREFPLLLGGIRLLIDSLRLIKAVFLEWGWSYAVYLYIGILSISYFG